MYSRAMNTGSQLTTASFPAKVAPFCEQFANEVMSSAVLVLSSIYAWNAGDFSVPFRRQMRAALHAAIDRHIQ